jgi:hypothetical protein
MLLRHHRIRQGRRTIKAMVDLIPVRDRVYVASVPMVHPTAQAPAISKA